MRSPLAKALQPQRIGQFTSTQSLSAPVGGINTRDPLDAMPPDDAIRMTNLIPDLSKVTVRPGSASFSTGVGSGLVGMVDVWEGPASTKLITAGGGELYDSSSSGAASVITSTASYNSDEWQTINFKGRLFGVNGSDAPWDYTGSALASTAWTGVTKANLINVWVYQERLWFALKDSAVAYYAGSGGITGGLTAFDLSQVAQHGGHLVAGGRWSRDGGAGLEDLMVFVMSTGELLVYQGTDPASDFVIKGSYIGARPIGRRCVAPIGGDLVVFTEAGILPVSMVMQGVTIDQIFAKTQWGKTARLIRNEAISHNTLWGWQANAPFPNGRVYFNIPQAASVIYHTYVLNIHTGAWGGPLTGLNATCWTYFNGDIYYGSLGGIVYKHSGTQDGAADITFDGKQAFNYFGSRNRSKLFTALRPVTQAVGDVVGSFGLDIDFSERQIPAGIHTLSGFSSGSAWDDFAWDVATWAGQPEPTIEWLSAGGEGRLAAIRFAGSVGVEMDWYSTDVMFKTGGIA